MPTRSDAIRYLVERGMEATTPKPTRTKKARRFSALGIEHRIE